jgi:hypothetical protein
VGKRAAKVGKFTRISLNITVPVKVSKAAWDHILNSVEQFEKRKKVSVMDLDIKSVPVSSFR